MSQPSRTYERIGGLLRRGAALTGALLEQQLRPAAQPALDPARPPTDQVRLLSAWVTDLELQADDGNLTVADDSDQQRATPRAPADLMARLETLEREVGELRRAEAAASSELARTRAKLAATSKALTAALDIDEAVATGSHSPTVGRPASTREFLIDLLADGSLMARGEIGKAAKAAGLTGNSISSALTRMRREGLVDHDRATATWRYLPAAAQATNVINLR